MADPPTPAAAPPGPGGAKGTSTPHEPTRGEQLVARRAAEVKATVPDTTYRVAARVDAALARAEALGAPVALVDLAVAACAAALRAHPRANAAYRDARVEAYARVNVALALPGADDAWVAPVLLDADARTPVELAQERERLAGRAAAGELTSPDLAGATFTLTDLGATGVGAFTPVLQAPQAAGLGMGAVAARPVARDGAVDVERVVELTLAADHRVLHGARAARLLAAIRDALEAP